MSLGEFNLAVLAEKALERLGDSESVFHEGEWHRSGALYERATRLAGGLIDQKVQPGDRVVVMMPNSPDVGVTYIGIWRAGGVAVPVTFLLPPDEVQRIIVHSEATGIVTTTDLVGTVQASIKDLEDPPWVICKGDADGTIPFEEILQSDPADIVERSDDELASLLYTGGTTGRSKGVMLTHENQAFCAKGLYDTTYEQGRTVSMTALPLSHGFGIMVTVSGFFAREQGKAVLMSWFDPTQWLENVQTFGVQRVAMVPSMVQMLLSQPLEDYDLSSWTFLGVGAAPIAREVIEEFERRVPGCVIHEGYGCTESGGGATASPPGRRKLGAVGKPYEGYEIRIVDEAGEPLPIGEAGEVCIRSRGVMKGYWKDPETTAEAIRNGWLHTGDVGRLDEDGYLYIVDRIKDLIIRGGFNVYPRDVEDVLLEHPAVQVAGVVGKPDERLGEEVVAFVSLHPGAETTAEDLIEHAKSKLGKYKYPREVRIVPYVPLTHVGKVDRKAMRSML